MSWMRWVYKLAALTGHSCSQELPVGAAGSSCPQRACYLPFPAGFVMASRASGENTNFCMLSVKEDLQCFGGRGRNRRALTPAPFVLWPLCAPSGSRGCLSPARTFSTALMKGSCLLFNEPLQASVSNCFIIGPEQ